MATWHQLKAAKRNPVRLYHETLWTALTDPINGLRTIMLFKTEAEAQAYAAKVPNTYVLKPANAEG